MRTLTAAAALLSFAFLEISPLNPPAYAQESCVGENCPQQGQSGRDCERKKNDETIS